MRVTVERQLVHRCPYRDEIDVGSVRASWDGDGVELHDLAHHLDSWALRLASHEEVTAGIAVYLAEHGGGGPEVVTRWLTAGLTVTVAA